MSKYNNADENTAQSSQNNFMKNNIEMSIEEELLCRAQTLNGAAELDYADLAQEALEEELGVAESVVPANVAKGAQKTATKEKKTDILMTSDEIPVVEQDKTAMELKLQEESPAAYAELSQWLKVAYCGKIVYIKLTKNDDGKMLPDFNCMFDVTNFKEYYMYLGKILNDNGKLQHIVNAYNDAKTPLRIVSEESIDPGVYFKEGILNICSHGKTKNIDSSYGDVAAGKAAWEDFTNRMPISDEVRPHLALWAAHSFCTNWKNRIILQCTGGYGSGKTSLKQLFDVLANGSSAEVHPESHFNGEAEGKRFFFVAETEEKLPTQSVQRMKSWAGETSICIERKGFSPHMSKQTPVVMFCSNFDFPIRENDGNYGRGSTRLLIVKFGSRPINADLNGFVASQRNAFKHKRDILAYLSTLLTGELGLEETIKNYQSEDLEEQRIHSCSGIEQEMYERIMLSGCNFKKYEDDPQKADITAPQTVVSCVHAYKLYLAYRSESAFSSYNVSTVKLSIRKTMERIGYKYVTVNRINYFVKRIGSSPEIDPNVPVEPSDSPSDSPSEDIAALKRQNAELQAKLAAVTAQLAAPRQTTMHLGSTVSEMLANREDAVKKKEEELATREAAIAEREANNAKVKEFFKGEREEIEKERAEAKAGIQVEVDKLNVLKASVDSSAVSEENKKALAEIGRQREMLKAERAKLREDEKKLAQERYKWLSKSFVDITPRTPAEVKASNELSDLFEDNPQ